VYRVVLQVVERFWHDLRFKDLHQNGKEFELMRRAMGFAAQAILTVIPLLIVVAAASPTSHHGLSGWVVYGMGLTGSSADAVRHLFSAPARVLSTTSAFSAGSRRSGTFPPGRGTRSGVRRCGWSPSSPTSTCRPRSAR
jgi:hypothetical protein